MSEEYEQEVSQENGRPLLKNRYAVDRELGRGGMSVVYLAHDRKLLNKPVVVKVLLEKQTQNEWVRKKFMQEMEALARIDHPGIINVLDYGDLPNGTQYLVMQYIEGKTLRDSIPQGGMEMSRASNLIRQVGQALAAAHEKGVWHRDLKPENIMISTLAGGEEHVKLIDFGIAGIKDSVFAGSKTNVAGSLTYMAPEQFAGKPSAASDLYALAIVAYEMLSGEIPFPEDSLTHLASAEQSHVTPLRSRRPEIPEAVDAVMRRALSFQPEARHRSVKEFAAELTAALYPPPVAEPALPPVPAAEAPSRRWLVAGLALASVLLVAVVLLWMAKRNTGGTAATGPQLALDYSMLIQRSRDGQDYGDVIRATGEMLVEHGHKIALEFSPVHDGHLYVLNGAEDASSGRRTWLVLHPMATATPEIADVEIARVPRENWFRFDDAAGTELLTVVWSKKPLPELDELIQRATLRGKTAVLDREELVKPLTFFLEKNRVPVQVQKNEANRQTQLRTGGEVLVHQIRLEHQ
ncbi:MAG: serine/threonine protein kinase [Acidobacteria bacterium]|nr:serine/threonine protein kinase [Acidobacteriota bacterium]